MLTHICVTRFQWVKCVIPHPIQTRLQCIMPWWRHQMETFSASLALYAGNSPVPVNSPHKCQWRGALMFSLICAWINDWDNNHEAGDLRCHRGHYDVNLMQRLHCKYSLNGNLSVCGEPILQNFKPFFLWRISNNEHDIINVLFLYTLLNGLFSFTLCSCLK